MGKKFIIAFLLLTLVSYSQTDKKIYEDEQLAVCISPAEPGIKDTIILRVSYSIGKIVPSWYIAESRLYSAKKTTETDVLKISFWSHCSHGAGTKNYYEIRIPPLKKAGKYAIEFVQGELYSDSRAYDTAKHCYERIGGKTTITVN